jgi:hypothetical protein
MLHKILVVWLTESNEIKPKFNERVGVETEDSRVDICKSHRREVCSKFIFRDIYGERLLQLQEHI